MSNHLRIVLISGDASALDPKSASSARLALYARYCEHLEVLVCTRTAVGERHTGNVSVRGVACTNVLQGIYRSVTTGEKIQKPDIVSTQDPFFLGIIGLFIARHYHIPLQIQIHTDLFDQAFMRFSIGNRIRSFVARCIISRADHLRVVSERIKKTLIEQKVGDPTRISVLPIPLLITPPAHHMREIGEREGVRILTVSRLTPEKDLSLALKAFAYVLKKKPDSKMVIVGDGPLRRVLEDEARQLGVLSAVTFTGAQGDVIPYYMDADVYVSTSHYEGYGLSLMEAAVCGLPIVSTDAGIARELRPSALVPQNAQKIADALTAPLIPSRAPASLLFDTKEYARRIVRDWETLATTHTSGARYTPLWFVMKYIISGGTATAVNLSFLYIFTDFFRVWYVFSAALAYASAFVVSFTLQKFWTFHNGTLTHIRSQFALYVALGTGNMMLNALLIYFAVESIGLHYLVAQIGIGVLIALWSLFFYRILFTNR